MSDNQIRLGIIGPGWWTMGVHWPRLKEDKRVEVTAICRRNERLLAEAAAVTGVTRTYTDWREMLDRENLDAVLVATPNYYHAEPTIAALEKGLHVLVEKPMALTSKDAAAMIAAAETAEGRLMVGYNRRCHPIWRKAHKAIREGAIGKIRQINTISYSNDVGYYDYSKWSEGTISRIESSGEAKPFIRDALRQGAWRGDRQATGGGMFVDIQTHRIDLMLWLAGSPPREVSCLLNSDGLPVERAITTHASLENGALFSLSYTNGVDADQKEPFGLTKIILTGDSGVLLGTEGGPLGPQGTQVEIVSGGEVKRISSEETTGGTTGMFLDLIVDGGENPAPPEECAWAVALTEASYRSAEEKRVVTLE